MKISVIIPSYKRPEYLARCLDGLKKQSRRADEIIVIIKDTDFETRDLFGVRSDFKKIKKVLVKIPGVIAALNAGLRVASGDIICFTDDDAIPHTDWIERIEKYFVNDPLIGGVGGKDNIYINSVLKTGRKKVVGKVSWFGRCTGNHDLGFGKPRQVDFLKGVNMSFLKKIFPKSFDKKCMGKRYQMHYEIDICLYLKRRGWKIVYDPSIQVNHYIAPKFEIINKDKNIRDRFNYGFFVGMVHNETYYLLKNLPILRKIVFLIWSFSIGTRANFGFLQWFRFLPREGRLSTKKLLVSFEGKLKALSSWIRYLCRSQL